jgi:hypothetical protein
MIGANYCCYFRKRSHARQNQFNLKKKETRNNHNQARKSNNGKYDRENCDAQDVVFVVTTKLRSSQMISGFVTMQFVGSVVILLRACSMLKRS